MPPTAPVRVSAIEFLNAAPLMWGLDADPRFTLAHALPSACARALADGTADLGVIPVIELARIPGLAGLAGMGVAARAQVRSILLISRPPAAEVRTLGLDRASRTSAALAQILLRRRFGARFAVADSGPDWRAALDLHDAALLIGDPALRLSISGAARRGGFHVYDLASEWHAWTGLPCVFALWGLRAEALRAHPWLPERLQAAKADGLAHREALVAAWAPRLDIQPAEVRHYLAADVEYDLSAEHHAGLQRFFALAAEEGLLPSPDPPPLLGEWSS